MATSDEKPVKMTQEKIMEGFQALRNEQRHLTLKLFEFEQDLNDHNMVIATLEKVNPGRRCFRMVGDTLVERNVKEILPAVRQNRDQLSNLVEEYNKRIVDKGKEINSYREQYGIEIRQEGPGGASVGARPERSDSSSLPSKGSSNSVLVEGK
ncbi:probable prefoldin subunit 2 [Varroa jacobsoni]|uniref:Prefoldin subunit 2 n=1 Tax=Varroa destructor TaxID=109461 RepID=A0A7M7K735_VARDE|nr:probable prefoldin subunit 2 [Varroa destructor]XP_022698283.1 probable prefoldin subunit 2 [Varroa jacobsoni]